MAISPDGRLALSGTQDFSDEDLGGELILWNIETGQIIRPLTQPGHCLDCVQPGWETGDFWVMLLCECDAVEC